MSETAPPREPQPAGASPELRPVPGTARGRGRIVVDLSDWVDRPTRRRAGVFRRALRREASRLRDPRRIAAVLLLSLTFALILSGLIARGEAGGADARAYWAGVRLWLNGGDPYHPTGPFLPYVYAPWMLPLFAPWALLPWDVAWFVWRVGTILLLLWTVHWAYRRRPLTTAVIVAVLAFPFAANLDTGNINLQLTLMLWAAQFTGPRLGGLFWALATWMKWVPAVFWPILPGAAKRWGLIWLAVSIALSLVMLPLTIVQFQALFGFGAQFLGPRTGGLIWGLATWMKWVPALLWPVLQPRARGWGLVFLAVLALLSLAMLPLTNVKQQVLFGFGTRPARVDYLVFIWAAVPWWWRHRDPFAFLRPSSWREASVFQLARARRWAASFRADPRAATTIAWHRLRVGIRQTVGLEDRRRRDRFAVAATRVPEAVAQAGQELVRPPVPDPGSADLVPRGGAAPPPGAT